MAQANFRVMPPPTVQQITIISNCNVGLARVHRNVHSDGRKKKLLRVVFAADTLTAAGSDERSAHQVSI